MIKTIYVVSERSFEYNDEIYHLPGDGSGDKSGVAKLAFPTKEQALSTRDLKNLEWFKLVIVEETKYHTYDLQNYTYDGFDDIFSEVVADRLNIKITTDTIKIPDNFIDENYVELMNSMHGIDLPWIVSEVTYQE